MNLPFKIFDRFAYKGKSNNKEFKQSIRKNKGIVHQAGRDINYRSARRETTPYLFISGTSLSINEREAYLGLKLTNASDETLFLERINIASREINLPNIHIEPHKTTSMSPITIDHIISDQNTKARLYYKSASGKKFTSLHEVTFEENQNSIFTIINISNQPPARRRK